MSKTALLTGSSRGLGFTLADFLAKQGYRLIIDARDGKALEEAAHQLRKYGSKVVAIAGDVTEAAHRQALVEAAREMGGLHLLVNNASTLGESPLPALTDYPLESLQNVFETNVIAPLALVQETLPLLKEKRGLIVNISSDAAVGGYEGWGGYGSSKAALDLMTKTLAAELANTGISAVSVDPGDMQTDMHQDAFPAEDISDRPLPEVTLPFWAWLLGQEPQGVSGQRFQAQSEHWKVMA